MTTRKRRSSSTADTEELEVVRPRKRTKTKKKHINDLIATSLGKRAGGVQRLMKTTEGVERLLWAVEQAESDTVEPFNETKLDDGDILLAAQIASALIIIRDGLEVGK